MAGPLALLATAQPQAPTVLLTRVDGTITPVIEEHLKEAVRVAARDGHAALLVEMDTPGGLLDSTRGIIQGFLGARVPAIAYVTPAGARAASAGAYITMSAHVAAMAPGTHIGAGTPVTQEGEKASDKVINDAAAFARSIAERRGRSTQFAEDMVRQGRAVSAREAVEAKAIDLVAPTRAALLAQVDGRRVTLGTGDTVDLRTAGARVVEHELGLLGGIRQLLASPELAFLFLSIGTLAIIYELANPGMGFAGIAGAILILLGFVALSVLPINAAGVALLVLAAVLFVAEVFVPGVGVFAAGGTVSLLLAGLFLFRGGSAVSPAVLWPTALTVGGGTLLAGRLAWRARRAPSPIGQQTLIGRVAVVRRAGSTDGQVLLDGSWWTVRHRTGSLTEGQTVWVVDQDVLERLVDTADEADGSDGSPQDPKEDSQ